MAPHRVALAESRKVARFHVENAAANVPRLRLVAVADPAPGSPPSQRRQRASNGLEDWRELLARDDVEALLVCSPSARHPEQIDAASDAGKHVCCEKPIAVDVAAADRAVAAADAAGIVLRVGYKRRFERSFAALREAVAAMRSARERRVVRPGEG